MYQFAALLQTGTAKFAALFQKFQKTVRVLRFNKIKVTSRSVFIDNVFALETDKEGKNDERPLFSDYLWILEQAVNR